MIEMNQMVYCVGGWTKCKNERMVNVWTKHTEIYDINTNKWSRGKDLNEEV